MKSNSYGGYVWKQFRKNKPAFVALLFLVLLLFMALFADLIANNQPLYAKYHGKNFYPAFRSYSNPAFTDSVLNPETKKYEILQFDVTDWRQLKLEKAIWPLIPYSPKYPDPYNRAYASPSGEQFYKNPQGEIVNADKKFRHILGTDRIGLDVASGIMHGVRISLRVGILAMGIAAALGLFFGALAGYFGDIVLRISRIKFWMIILGLIVGFFYAFIVRKYILIDAAEEGIFPLIKSLALSKIILFFVAILFGFIGHLLQKIPFLSKKIYAPVDSIISRLIEIMDSLPRLLLIITLAALFREKSLYLVMAIIGFQIVYFAIVSFLVWVAAIVAG